MHFWSTNPSDLFGPKSFKKNSKHKNTFLNTIIDHSPTPRMSRKVEISKERHLKYFPPFLKSQKRVIWNTCLLLPAWLHKGILWIRCTQSTRERESSKSPNEYGKRNTNINKNTHIGIQTHKYRNRNTYIYTQKHSMRESRPSRPSHWRISESKWSAIQYLTFKHL